MRIVVLTKRQYTNKDVIDDRYGRLWEIPLALAEQGNDVICICLSYKKKEQGIHVTRGKNGQSICWHSVNAGPFFVFGLIKFLFISAKYHIENHEYYYKQLFQASANSTPQFSTGQPHLNFL